MSAAGPGHFLSALFEPRSVAIVGATPTPGRVGGVLVSNLQEAGFSGELFAVNPKYGQVRGLRCHASMSALPFPADLAVIATPAPTIASVIADCGRSGTHAAVVITAGFGETGQSGAALERSVLEAARRHGVRLVGPNCLGILRPRLGLNASFARGSARPGGLALLSQSGAVCTAMLDWAAESGTGFSSVVSMGASVDLGFGEMLDYLTADEHTRHILLYIEGVRDARRFLGSLRAAARVKPIVLMKVGRHPVGSRAAVSHTGAIVGGDDVFEAALRRTAAVRVDSFGQFIAVAEALNAGVKPRGNRLAVITNGGGPGVMAADRAAETGVRLAELAPATIARLQSALPAHWSHGNPVDLIGDADSERYRAAVSACLEDEGVDGVLAMLTPQAMTDALEAAHAVVAAAKGSDKPLLACWMGERSVIEGRAALVAAGIPAFRTPETAVEAFAHIAAIAGRREALQVMPGPLADPGPLPDLAAARAIVEAAAREQPTLLDAQQTRALLRAFHIPVIDIRTAAGADEAAAAADAIGYPVAMKIRAAGITHKTEVGGVRLNLADAAAVREAFGGMLAAVARARPDARIEGVSLQPMITSAAGRELLVGIVRDPVFGPAITFGAGGTAVEVLRDRSVCLPPLDAARTGQMIDATRIATLLGAFRGGPAANRDAISAVLLRVSQLACEVPELLEFDINPLLADAQGAVALDARVLLDGRQAPRAGRESHAHLAIRPYPGHLSEKVALDDGAVVTLRPIRAEDALMEQRFVAGLSERSRQFRFLHYIAGLTPDMLARFADIDYEREMAFVAVTGAGTQEREIGVARYVPGTDGRSCEFAIVVADEWQGRGLGTRLLRMLFAAARSQGYARVTGQVRPDNLGMLALCRSLGCDISPWASGASTRLVSKSL